MATVTRAVGVVLIALGVLAYVGTGFEHPTALYRAVLGLVILVLGVLASREALHRHMIRGALVVALLGLIGSIPAAAELLTGAARPIASIVSLITALVCASYLGMGIRSFLAARRATEAN
jgi:hypothetical protein